ncbi:hypothetical protein [Anaerocellum danielii]|uniref:Uncharacterized protein n=1 Tax=Anaerocellum danielii TaxID=1387557 RepID=A0ABZ0TXF5_9FIRM|nr:hypothetical protein [Caldicellulosiruptor danielii]WPX08121.1 hypothetical protein SOJ16_001985 [Caldicellulosiruptor danielii]
MIKFAVVMINATGACNLYVLSHTTTVDTEILRKKLSKIPHKMLKNYIVDAEKGNLITRIIFCIPEELLNWIAA